MKNKGKKNTHTHTHTREKQKQKHSCKSILFNLWAEKEQQKYGKNAFTIQTNHNKTHSNARMHSQSITRST